MRFKLFSAFAILLLVGSNDARPSNIASPEVAEEDTSVGSSSIVPSDSRSKPPSVQRGPKNLQLMDQSLRTVATQLLNVTNPDDVTGGDKPKITKGELPPNIMLLRKPEVNVHLTTNVNEPNVNSKTKSDIDLVKEINSEISSLESMGIGFGRPTNSKFGYFESSHPGQAMAITEEELEREMMSTSTRLMTAHKNHPTTTGGISTWILLNSPTTTTRTLDDNDEKQAQPKTEETTSVKILEINSKPETKTSITDDKTTLIESTTPMERITILSKSTTASQKKTTTAAASRSTTTTEKTVKTTQKPKITQTAEASSSMPSSGLTSTDIQVTKPVTKRPTTPRSTPKLKITTPKPANVTSRPMTTKLRPNLTTKSKTAPSKKSTTRPSTVETTKSPNTSKIEKVTFRPVQMITTPKSLIESVERPMFVTKMKTSLFADSSSKVTTTQEPITEEIKLNSTDDKLVEIAMKSKPEKTNNVLKVQLKKPTESPTKIVIEPIKVNAPVLRIEKIADVTKKDVLKSNTASIPENSRVDLKFVFNPELTRLDVETATEVVPSSTTSKRPHKRKRNKLRRRKPTTLAPTSIGTLGETSTTLLTTTIGTTALDQETQETLIDLGLVENSIQESKIEPESKIGTNGTKNKKKQVQKPIGTQIYNFLSREVMPSFGVMSLVGLGLGLASYFLYPFGGAIARRNYVVEPNYKYSPEEYGGNYGQNEEEVFSKVLQGMTNNDGKYGGIKDYESNFHRYQHYDGAYNSPQTTRKGDPRYPTSSATNYRPMETTVFDNQYRNTEFKYPEIATTVNYYERHKQDSTKSGHGDRQFVVGNVPKEYGFVDKAVNNLQPTTAQTVDDDRPDNHKFGKDVDTSNYAQAEALRANEGYEEVEITPDAVAVEHGPRSLDFDSPKMRRKRESVIQMIPSRTEIEKEEKEIAKEEPLSNEIFDIIDSAIPEDTTSGGKNANKEMKKDDNKNKIDEGLKIVQSVLESNETKVVSSTESTAEAFTNVADVHEVTTEAMLDSTTKNEDTTTTTVGSLTIDEILGTTNNGKDIADSSSEWDDPSTTSKPHEENFNIFSFVKKIAEVKFKLGIAILKHASEGFARYLGHVQKRVNGEK